MLPIPRVLPGAMMLDAFGVLRLISLSSVMSHRYIFKPVLTSRVHFFYRLSILVHFQTGTDTKGPSVLPDASTSSF